MFAKRGAPKGVRKRPNAEEAEADQLAGAPAVSAAPEGSDEEHACIVKKVKSSRPACKHFLMGRVSATVWPRRV